ncbi:MAG: extracellular solute-binding protein [Deltaproteobacteria bacterium]|nr:extracellular solute-binding protein [Deltaproteobacteria bacterium]
MKPRPYLRAVVILISLILTAAVCADPLEKISEGAKKEGKLVFYAVLSAPETRALLDGFQHKYPAIQTEQFRLGADKMRTKILTEAKAGRHVFDVVSVNVIDSGALLSQRLFAPYRALAREAIPDGLKDEEGYWTAIYVRQFVLAYNTKIIAPKQAPKDWWELLERRWSAQLGLDAEETEWYAALANYWGKEKAQKLIKGLAAQKPSVRRGHSLIAELMSAGEFPLSLAYGSRIEEMKARGAPVDWVETTDPIVTSPSVISVSARAPHPNAAHLFLEYVLSREGQALLAKSHRVTVRKDVPILSPRLNVSRLKTFYVNPRIADRYNEYQQEYHTISWR